MATRPPALRSPTPSVAGTLAPPYSTVKPLVVAYDEVLPLFDYHPTAPFDLSILSENIQAGVIVQDVTYAAYNEQFATATQGRIQAFLVRPEGQGQFAGVLFLHQLERGQDRNEFLDEATSLARMGVVSLLPNGVFPWRVGFVGDGTKDQQNIINQVIELRRALDLLLAHPDVDPLRVGYIGHDYGAMHGALLAGVEPRVKAYVFMTGDSTYSNWALRYFVSPPDVDAYRGILAGTDPLSFVSHATPAAWLFQFSTMDRFIPQDVARSLFAAASDPKEVRWYEAGHNLDDRATEDRVIWLTGELGLSPLP